MCFVSVAHAAVYNMSAIPQDGTSLLVRWISVVSFGIKEFVVEWRPLLNTNISSIQFETADRNQTSLLIKGMFYSICAVFYASIQQELLGTDTF